MFNFWFWKKMKPQNDVVLPSTQAQSLEEIWAELTKDLDLPLAIDPSVIPFRLGEGEEDDFVEISSHPFDEPDAEGPFSWIDLENVEKAEELLIDGDQVVLETDQAILVLDYPFNQYAIKIIKPDAKGQYTLLMLVQEVDRMYRQVYDLETNSQSLPTPPIDQRGHFINRPNSDGTFGIWGHDLRDLGISGIEFHNHNGVVWINPHMES